MNPLTLPHLDQYINDFSWVLPEAKRRELNEVFAKHEQQTTEQVVVVLFPHRQWNELLDIGLQLFNENGIGQKNLNNGLLLIIATEEKKIRIITGKGMELKYTEMWCRDIIENSLRPLLNEGRYEELLTRWKQLVTNQKNLGRTYGTSPKNTVDTPVAIFAIEVITLIFWGILIDGILSWIIWVIIGAILLYGTLWFLRERWFILKLLLSVIPIGFIAISILAIIAPAKCTLTESNIITGAETYACERDVLGHKMNYTTTYGGTSSNSSSHSSSWWSSSSSFDGWGGSSNGGGYGD